MIRPTVPDDSPDLLATARETKVFKPMELAALKEVLDDYHIREQANGHRALTFEHEGRPVGFVYYAPAAMTDRAWYLYWIAVEVTLQGGGRGSALLRHVEQEITAAQGRLLLVETSSLPLYEPTRQFYRKHNYEQLAHVTDYYADGDSMVVFGKKMR